MLASEKRHANQCGAHGQSAHPLMPAVPKFSRPFSLASSPETSPLSTRARISADVSGFGSQEAHCEPRASQSLSLFDATVAAEDRVRRN